MQKLSSGLIIEAAADSLDYVQHSCQTAEQSNKKNAIGRRNSQELVADKESKQGVSRA